MVVVVRVIVINMDIIINIIIILIIMPIIIITVMIIETYNQQGKRSTLLEKWEKRRFSSPCYFLALRPSPHATLSPRIPPDTSTWPYLSSFSFACPHLPRLTLCWSFLFCALLFSFCSDMKLKFTFFSYAITTTNILIIIITKEFIIYIFLCYTYKPLFQK